MRGVAKAWLSPPVASNRYDRRFTRDPPSTRAAALAISRWAKRIKTEAAGILAKYPKVPQRAMLRTQRYTPSETIDPNQLQPLIDAAAKYGIISKAFSASEIMLP